MSDLFLSPKQQDLLMAALTSNQPKTNQSPRKNTNGNGTPQRKNTMPTPSTSSAPGSGQLDYTDDSPYLDFALDSQIDDSFNYADGKMFGDLPDEDDDEDEDGSNEETHDLHEKRKSMGDPDEDDEGGGKRREGEDKTAKKPGRKPLTSEPTTKRKAQNRAAQRAFRERKEKHLKDLETKVEDLEKASEAANHENGLLKAQIERMQVELKEYRKRLSWISNNGSARQPSAGFQSRSAAVNSAQSDFAFQFPKFGDVPVQGLFGASPVQKANSTQPQRQSSVPSASPAQSTASRGSIATVFGSQQPQRSSSMGNSPANKTFTASPPNITGQDHQNSVDSLSGLFSPSILEATRQSPTGYFGLDNFGNKNNSSNLNVSNNAVGSGSRSSFDNSYSSVPGLYSGSSITTTESPGSSADSHQPYSSIGTSPDPLFNSPNPKLQDSTLNTINENSIFDSNAWNINSNNFSTEFDTGGFNFLAQQNGGGFDPILFGDYREPQDNILSQDFGSFFNDAYPLPDLGSPSHSFGETNQPQGADGGKTDLLQKVDMAKNAEPPKNETPKMMTCNKIWDRLQSMEKFRNGEIDIDNLCSELRAKAKCSEGGAVVEEKHVNKILGL